MFIGFPINTVFVIILTMIAAAAAVWLILSQGLKKLPATGRIQRFWSGAAAILLGGWLLARLLLAAFPPAGSDLAGQFLISFTSLGFGLLAGLLPLLFSPAFRQMLRSVPVTWLVGVHAVRLAGFLFLALLDMNLLPAGFTLPAGYGDMTVGLLALGLVVLLARNNPYARSLAVGWNLLGLLDFVSALTTGGMFIAPFARQLAASGVSLTYLNYVLLVPSFGVPLYAVLHLYSLFQLAAGRVEEPLRRAVVPTGQRSLHPER